MDAIRLGEHVFVGNFGDEPLSERALIEMIQRMNLAREKAGLAPWIDPKQGWAARYGTRLSLIVSRLGSGKH